MMQRFVAGLGGVEMILGAVFQQIAMPDWLAGIVIAAGVLTLGYAIFGMRGPISIPPVKDKKWSFLPNWRLSSVNLTQPPCWRVMSLRRAAQIAHKRTISSELAKIAERPYDNNKPADPLGYYATAIANNDKDRITVYGILPPSTWLREIPRDDMVQGRITDEGKTLLLGSRQQPRRIYENLHIRRADFWRRLAKMKTWG